MGPTARSRVAPRARCAAKAQRDFLHEEPEAAAALRTGAPCASGLSGGALDATRALHHGRRLDDDLGPAAHPLEPLRARAAAQREGHLLHEEARASVALKASVASSPAGAAQAEGRRRGGIHEGHATRTATADVTGHALATSGHEGRRFKHGGRTSSASGTGRAKAAADGHPIGCVDERSGATRTPTAANRHADIAFQTREATGTAPSDLPRGTSRTAKAQRLQGRGREATKATGSTRPGGRVAQPPQERRQTRDVEVIDRLSPPELGVRPALADVHLVLVDRADVGPGKEDLTDVGGGVACHKVDQVAPHDGEAGQLLRRGAGIVH